MSPIQDVRESQIDRLRFIHIQFPPGTPEETYDAFVKDLGALVNMHVEAYEYGDEPEVQGGIEAVPANKWAEPVVTRKPK